MSIGYWPVFDGMLVPIHINMNTINALYGLNLSSNEVSKFLKEKAEKKIVLSHQKTLFRVTSERISTKNFSKVIQKNNWAWIQVNWMLL
jgi:UDP-galactopyranose mutase